MTTSRRRRANARPLVVAAVGVVAIVAGLWILGSSRSRNTVISVVQTASPAVASRAVPQPTASRRPAPSVRPSQEPPAPIGVSLFGNALSVTVPADATYVQHGSVVTISTPTERFDIHRWSLSEPYALFGDADPVPAATTFDGIVAAIDRELETVAPHAFDRDTRVIDFRDGAIWLLGPDHAPVAGKPFAVAVDVFGGSATVVAEYERGSSSYGTRVVRLMSLVDSLNVLTPTHITALGGRISMELPGTMHIELDTEAALTVKADSAALFGPLTVVTVRRFDRNVVQDVVVLPSAGKSITLDGRSLAAIAAALEAGDPSSFRAAWRESVSIDGARGYHWRIPVPNPPLPEIFGPLFLDVTVLIHGDDWFVFNGKVGNLGAISLPT